MPKIRSCGWRTSGDLKDSKASKRVEGLRLCLQTGMGRGPTVKLDDSLVNLGYVFDKGSWRLVQCTADEAVTVGDMQVLLAVLLLIVFKSISSPVVSNGSLFWSVADILYGCHLTPCLESPRLIRKRESRRHGKTTFTCEWTLSSGRLPKTASICSVSFGKTMLHNSIDEATGDPSERPALSGACKT